jgi:hypothetical protein
MIAVVHYHAASSMWMVDMVSINHTACIAICVVWPVWSPDRMIMNVGDRSPTMPPDGAVIPIPRRHPAVVVRAVHVLDGRPAPNVYNGTARCSACVSPDFTCGFNDGLNAIDIFIADDLEHGFAIR